MDNMIVKNVDVMGDTIMAAKDKDGIIWVGIKWMCQGMGMSDGQYKRQIKNIQKDLLLKNSGSNLILNKGSGEREVFCLKLDYLPIWLAKISITPTIQKEHPELADKLLEYQLKAKDILAAAFLPEHQQTQKTTMELLELHYKALKEVNEKAEKTEEQVNTLEQRFNEFRDNMPVTGADMDDIQSAVKKKGVEMLGGKESNAYKDQSTRTYVYADIQCELRRQFRVKRYKEIKHKNAEDALRIIGEYKLPIALKDRVDMVNAQQSLNLEGGAVNE